MTEHVIYFEVTVTSCSYPIQANSAKEAREIFKNEYKADEIVMLNRTNITKPKIVNTIH